MQKQWATSSKKNKSIYCLLVNTGCKNNVKSLDTDFFVFKQEVLSFDFLRYFWTSHVSLVVKNPQANAGRHNRCGFNPWVGKIPWRRAQQPTPVFLNGESHGQKSLVATAHRLAKSWTWLKGPTTHVISSTQIQVQPLFSRKIICKSLQVLANRNSLIDNHKWVDKFPQN